MPRRGRVRPRPSQLWKEPDQASRLVRKFGSWKMFLIEAMIEVPSYWLVGVGSRLPVSGSMGSWITVPLATQGETSTTGSREPSRSNWKAVSVERQALC